MAERSRVLPQSNLEDRSVRVSLTFTEVPMGKQRRHFSGTDKVAILKQHLLDKVSVSDLCDKHDIYPTQFYAWLKEFFENGHAAFDNGRKSKAEGDAKDRKIESLEAKLTRKNEVLSELMEEHTQLKKNLGEV
jgi:transposase-like protein